MQNQTKLFLIMFVFAYYIYNIDNIVYPHHPTDTVLGYDMYHGAIINFTYNIGIGLCYVILLIPSHPKRINNT